jgi:hypothetical protein
VQPSPVAVARPGGSGESPGAAGPPSPARPGLEWLGLSLLIVPQLLLFASHVRTHVSPFYPINHDQLQVLEWAYRGALAVRANPSALLSALGAESMTQHAQFFKGPLLPLLAMASSSLFGIHRLSAALVNFAALAAGECAIYWYLRRRGGVPCGVLGVGLFLLASTHYYWVGGLDDLRRDYLGVLAMGVAFMTVAGYLVRGGRGIGAPALALVLVALSRSVSLVYWVLALGAACVLLALGTGLPPARAWVAARLGPCLRLLAVTSVIAGVQFALDLRRFWQYYAAFRLSGAASVRFREFGAVDRWQTLLYYPASLLEHSGTTLVTALVLAVALVPLGLLERGWRRPGAASDPTGPGGGRLGAHVLLFVLLAASSMAILTWYQPSPVPMGSLVVPLVVCVSLALRALSLKVAAGALMMVGGLALALGLGRFATEMLAPSYPPGRDGVNGATVRGLQAALYDHVDRTAGAGPDTPTASWLLVHDGLNKYVFDILAMERGAPPRDSVRHNQLPAVDAVPPEELVTAVAISDIVVGPLRMDGPPLNGFEYPGNASVRQLLGRLGDELSRDFDLVAAGPVVNPTAVAGLWVRRPGWRPTASPGPPPGPLPGWLEGRVRFEE